MYTDHLIPVKMTKKSSICWHVCTHKLTVTNMYMPERKFLHQQGYIILRLLVASCTLCLHLLRITPVHQQKSIYSMPYSKSQFSNIHHINPAIVLALLDKRICTTGAVAQHCVNDDQASQWRKMQWHQCIVSRLHCNPVQCHRHHFDRCSC